jgi:soluble lytic murein transglycosylase-like protein
MTKDQIKQLVIDYAYGYGIEPAVAVEQIQRESNFNPNAIGSSGERGLAQFMPGTWERFSDRPFDDAFDIDWNLTAWGNYMQYLLNLLNWDYSKALTGYNGGEGHILNPDRYGAPSSAAQRYAREILTKAQTSGEIYATDDGQALPPLGPGDQSSNFLTYLLIGTALIVGLIVLRD